MKTVIIKQSKSRESLPSITLRPSTSLSPAAFLIPTSGISSSSVASSTPSTPNFETIYFPLKEECADDNTETSRDENPLGDKNKSESSRKIGNKITQPNIQVVPSIASKKGVEPPHISTQTKILQSVPSAPATGLIPLTQSQRPQRTRHLRKILPKAPPENPRGKKPIILKSQNETPAKRSIIQKIQDIPPAKPSIIQKSPDLPLAKPPIIQKSQDAPPVKQIFQKPQDATPLKSAGVCLRWKNYHSYMQNTFPSMLDSEDFVDVTLACEGKSVKCHKIILSSCSDYLAYLLRENPCPHPIILMKDLKFWEMEALVQYMYKGEAHVPHEQLSELLNAAKTLGIKGLAGFNLDEEVKVSVERLKQAYILDKDEPDDPEYLQQERNLMSQSDEVQAIPPTAPQQQIQQSPHQIQQQQQQKPQQYQQRRRGRPKKAPKEPVAVLPSEPRIPQKSSLLEDQIKPSLIQFNEKRPMKRCLETRETRQFVKIRLRRAKSPILRAESPEIKYEPIDLPPSPVDNIPDNNNDDIVQHHVDLEEMHEDNDLRGDESTKVIDGADDNEEFVGNEFLDDENIIDAIDHGSCRNSFVDDDTAIGKINANNILRIRKSKEKDET